MHRRYMAGIQQLSDEPSKLSIPTFLDFRVLNFPILNSRVPDLDFWIPNFSILHFLILDFPILNFSILDFPILNFRFKTVETFESSSCV